MGYRARLGKIAKSMKDSYAFILNSDDWVETNHDTYYRPNCHTELYELGKYLNTPEHLTPFYNFETDDNEFHILSKEGLAVLIKSYAEDVAIHYLSLLDQIENLDTIDVVRRSLKTHANMWSNQRPYYLDEPHEQKDGAMSPSFLKEYCIFNLVYIYQTFDWENDYLIYSGY